MSKTSLERIGIVVAIAGAVAGAIGYRALGADRTTDGPLAFLFRPGVATACIGLLIFAAARLKKS